MSKVEVNTVEPQCGTTLTLGGSGDTVALACGASQTGFGRTGTVDWDTASIKTAGFVAVSGKGYFCNTTGGIFTVTLPASPSAGDIVAVKDYAGTFDTNNLTLGRNSSNIEGAAADAILSTESLAVTYVYADGTKGWLAINDMAASQVPKFVTATGGTPCSGAIVCTDYKVHTFTSPGTLVVSCAGNEGGSTEVSYMVVAGGGGSGSSEGGGGGGAGGFREGKSPQTPYTASPLACTAGANNGLTVEAIPYAITVGGGGAGGPYPSSPSTGVKGSDSVFSSITSTGGGYGSGHPTCTAAGGPGGSGGGGGARTDKAGGTGNTPPFSPSQGKDGGNGAPGSNPSGVDAGGGGGGATVAATNAACFAGTDGGAGATTSISGSPTAYSGGGGGGQEGGTVNCGGVGGGGNGGFGSTGGTVGTVNTGGGGGGSGSNTPGAGKAGGSGIVIIRYKFQ